MHTILWLCTGNSARSILAEAILNAKGQGRLRAYSAGSQPKGAVHPESLRLLAWLGHPTEGLRSKSWDEFAAPGAPRLDAILTVCDQAAGETCPIWPGHPASAHWGLPDPAAVTGSPAEVALAFAQTYAQLERRIDLLVALPDDAFERAILAPRLRAIAAEALAEESGRPADGAPHATAP